MNLHVPTNAPLKLLLAFINNPRHMIQQQVLSSSGGHWCDVHSNIHMVRHFLLFLLNFVNILPFSNLLTTIRHLNHDIGALMLALKEYLLHLTSYLVDEFTAIENP
jgi:hypothetical protein